MAIEFNTTAIDGFDKELLLISEGYTARPVTLTKDTISGLAADDDGHYIIPQGTYLTGENGVSLLIDPEQYAVAVTETVTLATLDVNSSITFTAKNENSAPSVELVKGTSRNASVSYDQATNTLTVTLGVDSDNDVVTTYAEIVDLVNDDVVANTYLSAALDDGVSDEAIAAEAAAASLATAAEGTVSGDIDGILYHSVDVTDGEASGAMIIHGYINIDNMPVAPSAAVRAKLPHIVFGRRD